jgi:hypothetical protein
MTRIKKFKNNEYILQEGVWVRNLCREASPVDINSLGRKDMNLFLANESANMKVSSLQLDDLNPVDVRNLVILSDGYGWKEKQLVLGDLPNTMVKTIGVNGSLAKWEMVGDKAEIQRTMTFYLVNNPYPECTGYLPRRHRYYPNLIASTKTNPKFLNEYKSQPFLYKSTQDLNYSGIGPDQNCMSLDDYRNPVCAAISFAWRKGVKKMVLLCCDEAFQDERPGAVKMKNGLYQYPQQIMCQKIIDGQLHWLRRAGVRVADCSSGIEYANAAYIEIEGIKGFFEKEEDD